MAMTITEAMTTLIGEYEAEEVENPLAARFTLAGIWDDLARIAGEALPSEAAAALGALRDEPIDPLLTDVAASQRDRAVIDLRRIGPLHWA